jgi:sugar lactone lactonase YvrE
MMRIFYGLALCGAGLLAGCTNGGDDTNTFNRVWGNSDPALVDGNATTARFSNPANVVVASDGTAYVADYDNDAVRSISTGGTVATAILRSDFQRPFGLTLSLDNKTLYVETDGNDMGARDSTTGTIWGLNRSSGVATVVARNLGRPRGILTLPDGRIAMSDLVQNVISILDPATAAVTPLVGAAGTAGFTNGTGTAASFSRPYGMALMPDGSLLVADQNNNAIRQVTLAGVVTTFAGTGSAGLDTGDPASATFNGPEGVAVSSSGIVYVADTFNHVVRRISGGTVIIEAGNGTAGFVDVDNRGDDEFFGLEGIGLTADGKALWIADGNGGNGDPYNRVRRIQVP